MGEDRVSGAEVRGLLAKIARGGGGGGNLKFEEREKWCGSREGKNGRG